MQKQRWIRWTANKQPQKEKAAGVYKQPPQLERKQASFPSPCFSETFSSIRFDSSDKKQMAGGGGSPTKKVEAETTNNSSSDTLLPPKFVSVFALCERCNKRIYGNQHNCSFDANLETEAKKKKPVEKKKRPPTAFYIFMDDFRETFESENPYINVKNVAKLGGETWKSFTDDEKKVYRDKAAKLMEEYNKSLESNDAADDDVEEDEEKQADEAEENGVENKEDAPNGGQNGRGRGLGRRRGILCRGVRGRRSAFG